MIETNANVYAAKQTSRLMVSKRDVFNDIKSSKNLFLFVIGVSAFLSFFFGVFKFFYAFSDSSC